MEKKGQILAENVIFIVLNLLFLSVLILFIFSKTGGEAILEEKYSKQIALMIDSAKPVMIIHLNMEDAIKKAEKNKWDTKKIVFVEGNTVTVKLREKGENSYSFFNDVDVSIFPPSKSNNPQTEKEYVIKINRYN